MLCATMPACLQLYNELQTLEDLADALQVADCDTQHNIP